MKAVAFLVLAGACASTATIAPVRVDAAAASTDDRPLARFMREVVSVPYSFAVLEQDGRRRPVRFERAAIVLQDAARDLVHWEDPPVESESAREVFYTYARSLEQQVGSLQSAARAHHLAEATVRLEKIRQTCNSCHRFFRPASVISKDVLYDRMAFLAGESP